MRGQEILSGAQRVHNADVLKHRLSLVEPPIDPKTVKDYVDAFEYGAPPHAGAGLGKYCCYAYTTAADNYPGLDRIVQFFLNLPNIRLACAFPRDPGRIAP